MIDVESVDPYNLPYIDFPEFKKLPNISGIYFVADHDKVMHYIGMAGSIKQRWISNHHKKEELLYLNKPLKIYYLQVTDYEKRPEIESFFIRKLQPLLNSSFGFCKKSDAPKKGMKVIWTQEKDIPGLGAKIKAARQASNRHLTDICSELRMSTANWYRIEEEKQNLPVETLRKIESVLGVNFEVEF